MDSETTSSPGSASGQADTRQRAGPTKSKATIRASLACVPCRSKHVKCDSALPACLRCRLEEKTCYYARSRRGIRDPKKRSLINDPIAPSSAFNDSSSVFPSPELDSFEFPINVIDRLPGGWSLKDNPQVPDSRTVSPTSLLFDLYFTNFHNTHPWLLPKSQLLNRIRSDPQQFHFLANCITYIGSLFSGAVSSEELREKAFSLASGGLPMTVWTVQGLLVLSVAAFGENRMDLSCGWMDAATQMALDLGMQERLFADAEPDPVLAESFRRTYWALYAHGNMRALHEESPTFALFGTRATTELPCEEWEYQSGEIPQPTSLENYDARDPMNCRSYSSWTYYIDLCRISGELVLPLSTLTPDVMANAVDRADSRIASWLINLPKWKQQLVDSSGAVDMVLFPAIACAHGLRIRMQLPAGALGIGVRDLLTLGPLFRTRDMSRNRTSTHFGARCRWLECSTALQAGLSTIGLFNFSLPPARYSPVCIPTLRRAALPLLDARMYGAVESPALREKLDLLLGVLKVAGEMWPVAKNLGNEVSEVTRELNVTNRHRSMAHFDPALDAFINSMSSGVSQDSGSFAFSGPRTAEDILDWTTGLTGTFQV